MVSNMNNVASLIEWNYPELQNDYIKLQVNLIKLYNELFNEDNIEMIKEKFFKVQETGETLINQFFIDHIVETYIMKMFMSVLEFTVMNIGKVIFSE